MNYLADNKKNFFDSFSEQFNSVLTEQKNKAINEQNALKNKTEQERERLKREYQNTQSTIIETQDKCKKDLTETLNRELAKWQQFARQSVVLMPPYKTTKVNNVHCLYLQNDEIPTLKDLRKEQEERIFLPALPVGMKGINVDDTEYYLPVYADWQGKNDDKQANFYITYDEKCCEQAYDLHNAIFIRMFAAFATGNIAFSCINPTKQRQCCGYWFQRLFENAITDSDKRKLVIERLFHTFNYAFTEDSEIKDHLDILNDRVTDCVRVLDCNSWREYNQRNNRIVTPYEVVFVYEPFWANVSVEWKQTLQNLIRDGYKAGIYFVFIQSNKENVLLDDNSHDKWENSNWGKICNQYFMHLQCKREKNGDCSIPSQNNVFYNIIEPWVEQVFPIVEQLPNTGLLRGLFTDIVDDFERINERRAETRRPPFDEWINRPYKHAWNNKIEVPIGRVNDKTEHSLCLDEGDKVHSFIVGNSGSGKSVLLENFIVAATAKYSPKSLQLYLCDFKGNDAFTSYANLPHVRWSVNDIDKTVQYAMLQELLVEMVRRYKYVFPKKGATTLSTYNAAVLDSEKLPCIVVIYDEFQNFFIKEQPNESSDLQKSITGTLTRFEKEGRGAGIHIIKATQSVSSIPINSEDFTSGHNNYVLKADLPATIGNVIDDKITALSVLKTKWITAAYEEGNKLLYIDLYLLNNRSEEKNQKIIDALSRKCISQEGQKELSKYVHAKYPSTKLPPIYRYETTQPCKYTREIGVSLLGTEIIGIKEYSNVLIAGTLYDSSKELTTRIVFGLLRNTLETASKIYLFTQWFKYRERFKGMEHLHHLMNTNRITLCDGDDGQMSATLMEIEAELEKRMDVVDKDRNARFSPIYLYILDYDNISAFSTYKSSALNFITKLLQYGKNFDIYTIIHRTAEVSSSDITQFDVQIFQYGAKTREISDIWTLQEKHGKEKEARVVLKDGNGTQLIWPFLLPEFNDNIFTVVPKQEENHQVMEEKLDTAGQNLPQKKESKEREQEIYQPDPMSQSTEFSVDENGRRNFRDSYRSPKR